MTDDGRVSESLRYRFRSRIMALCTREFGSWPPTGDYDVATLDEAFTDPARTRFFTASAKDPAWIGWLDRHEHLLNLFRRRAQLAEPERELAK